MNNPDVKMIIGDISGEFSCQYNNATNGTLFVGSCGLYYLTKALLFEKKIWVKWTDVLQVKKSDECIIAVEILPNKDELYHTFTFHSNSYQSIDRIWSILAYVRDEALLNTEENGSTKRHFPLLHRTNSDPSLGESTTPKYNIETAEKMNNGKIDPNDCENKIGVINKQDKSSSFSIKSKEMIEMKDYLFKGSDSEFYKLIGEFTDKFQCSNSNFKGSVIAGDKSIGFVGQNFFFIPRKIIIKWDAVQQFQVMNNAPQGGIEVTTRNDTQIRFINIEEPKRLWECLNEIKQKVQIDYPLQHEQQRCPPHQIANSDPSLTVSQGATSLSSIDGTNVALIDDLENESSPNGSISQHENEKQLSIKRLWTNLVNETSVSTECVINKYELPCNLDTFYELFVANNSKYSISLFLKEQGEENIDESPWEDDECNDYTTKNNHNKLLGDVFTSTRVLFYDHQVNVPLAPPMTRARREQEYKRCDNYGICMDTKTYVDDFPIADCFYVHDRLIVQPKASNKSQENENENESNNSDSSNSDSIVVRMEFEIIFVKSTMFRGLITKTAKSEMNKYLENYIEFILASVSQYKNPQQEEENNPRIVLDVADVDININKKARYKNKQTTNRNTFAAYSFLGKSIFDFSCHFLSSLVPTNAPTPLTLTMVVFLQGLILYELHDLKFKVSLHQQK